MELNKQNTSQSSIVSAKVSTHFSRIVRHLPVENVSPIVPIQSVSVESFQNVNEIERTKRLLLEKTKELKLKLDSLKITKKN